MDMPVVAVIILCIKKDFHSGIPKLFERNFHPGSNSISFILVRHEHEDCGNFIFNSFAFYTHTQDHLI